MSAIKFAVGYQLDNGEEGKFLEIAGDFRDQIEEVYFPWLDMPSGRPAMTVQKGVVDWNGQHKLEKDLIAIKGMGIKLNLLLNANCYGKYSLSMYLENLICSIIAHLREFAGLDIVTTASLMAARIVKTNFPNIDVRASVNMRIGTIKAMEYASPCFDSFYIQREYNRDFERIRELKTWAGKHGKRLYILANSGCLNFCPGQVFHDNIIAHDAEIKEMRNIDNWNPFLCWNYYKEKKNWVSFLQNSWIRPEDIGFYRDLFPVMKLATRTHANPRKVIQAYCRRSFKGNLLDLLEPGYGPVFLGYAIDNTRFPKDWFEKVVACGKQCYRCGYCLKVLKKILLKAA